MPTATVTVRYVNPPKPGKKMGSIKTTDDQYYGVWPDKLSSFESGQTYNINYTVNDGGFKNFKNFVDGPAAVGQTQAARRVTQMSAPADERRAAEMFVMGFVNRLYQGMGSPPAQGELTEAIRTARYAWQDAWAEPKLPPQVPDDQELNDEIPF